MMFGCLIHSFKNLSFERTQFVVSIIRDISEGNSITPALQPLYSSPEYSNTAYGVYTVTIQYNTLPQPLPWLFP